MDETLLTEVLENQNSKILKGQSWPTGSYPNNTNLLTFKINIIHHISSIKRKMHMFILTDANDLLAKIQHPFMVKKKNLSKLKI